MAAIAIFVAMVLDGLDGRVARLTHTQSAFGAEYDSLADMVSLRRRAGAGDVRVGAARTWASSAGSPPSSTARARRCASRASTRSSRSPTSAGSQGLPSPRPAALVAGLRVHRRRLRRRDGGRCNGGPGRHGVRRAHDGVEPQVLQLQDDQPASGACRSSRSCSFVRADRAAVATSRAIVLFGGFVAYALSGYVDVGLVDVAPATRSPPPRLAVRSSARPLRRCANSVRFTDDHEQHLHRPRPRHHCSPTRRRSRCWRLLLSAPRAQITPTPSCEQHPRPSGPDRGSSS